MYLIEKEFNIGVSHRLSKHLGLCKNFHGHNLKIIVGIKSEYLNYNDMVVDFSDLKNIVNEIISVFDHATLLNSMDTDYIEFIKNKGSKLVLVDGDPTCENLCKILFDNIALRLSTFPSNVSLVVSHVTIYETDSSKCTYTKD